MWNQGSIQKDDGSKYNKMSLFAFEFLNGLTFCKN